MADAPVRVLHAGASHLYPGVRLAGPAVEDWPLWQTGDAVLIEFADLTTGQGTVEATAPGGWQVRVAARTTAKGTATATKTWWLAPHPSQPGQLRVRRPAR